MFKTITCSAVMLYMRYRDIVFLLNFLTTLCAEHINHLFYVYIIIWVCNTLYIPLLFILYMYILYTCT